jgi:hypothetical protein
VGRLFDADVEASGADAHYPILQDKTAVPQ